MFLRIGCEDLTLAQKYIDGLNTSCGRNGISSELLKKMKDVLVDTLTAIINQSLCTGVFPDNLKVVPRLMKGYLHLLDDYWLIGLFHSFPPCPIFFKRWFSSSYVHISPITILSTKTNVRKHHSLELAIMELIDRISDYNSYMDTGMIPISIFLDLSKVFDTLDSSIHSWLTKSIWFCWYPSDIVSFV